MKKLKINTEILQILFKWKVSNVVAVIWIHRFESMTFSLKSSNFLLYLLTTLSQTYLWSQFMLPSETGNHCWRHFHLCSLNTPFLKVLLIKTCFFTNITYHNNPSMQILQRKQILLSKFNYKKIIHLFFSLNFHLELPLIRICFLTGKLTSLAFSGGCLIIRFLASFESSISSTFSMLRYMQRKIKTNSIRKRSMLFWTKVKELSCTIIKLIVNFF